MNGIERAFVKSDSPTVSPAAAWWTVSLLSLLYVFSSLDRFVLALVVEPIKVEFGVSDTMIGLLLGPVFAVFYAGLSIPLARIADSGNRRRLIFFAATLWGLSTLGTGLANAFLLLVFLRIGLAVGEAALSPAAHSMIGDMFAPGKRMFAASIYTGIGQAGTAASGLLGGAMLVFAGYLVHSGVIPAGAEWRMLFVAAGFPALLLGFVFITTVREPARIDSDARKVSTRDVMAMIMGQPRLYLSILAGMGFMQISSYAFITWTPELLRRQYGWTMAEAAFGFGAAKIGAGLVGTLATPMISRALERAGRSDGVLVASFGTLLVGGVTVILSTTVTSPIVFLALFAVGIACVTGSNNNLVVAQQIIAPPRMRGTMIALIVISTTMIGQGLGPLLVPLVANAVPVPGRELSAGLMVATIVAVIPALALLLFARKPYRARAADGWRYHRD